MVESRRGKAPVDLNTRYQGDGGRRLEDGLLKAAVLAAQSSYNAEATVILETAKIERPQLWSFVQPLGGLDVYRYLAKAAIRAHIENRAIDDRSVLPRELSPLVEQIPTGVTGEEFRRELRAQLDAVAKDERGLPGNKRSLGNDTLREAERFIRERLASLVELSQCLARVLCSPGGRADVAFQELVGRWTKLRKSAEDRVYRSEPAFFWRLLGRQLVTFSVWARSDLGPASVDVCVKAVTEDAAEPADVLIELATILGRRRAYGLLR